MNKEELCECCGTNAKKAKNAKYCLSCSDYINGIVWQRVHRVDARYKKIFRSMFVKLKELSEEEQFLPNNVKELIDENECSLAVRMSK
jgi:hypothetical protein